MTHKARAWTGITLLLVLIINYMIIGMPLIKRRAYIKHRANDILVVKNADDEYILDIFRREGISVNKKIRVVNSVGISLAVIIASWTIFGLIFSKKSK